MAAEKRPDRVRGPGHDEFWAGCEAGELRLQRCADCTRISWPVTKACEYCASPRLAFETLSGRARLVSWCAFERDYYKGVLPLPWATILVELEEGAMFVSNPAGIGYGDLKLDMPLKVTFVDCEDGTGAFRLTVFERG
jgi:uncharacterized OB-fold protein